MLVTPPASLVRRWLLFICTLIILMIAVGGITRLTLSGLSIVEWNPIMGAIPPLSEADWNAAFDQYKQYPQYQKMFPNLALAEFKSLYFWEWIHRLLGRLMGLAYLLPWIGLTVLKKIPRGFQGRIAIGFFLGGSQGLLGWIMVKSGLVDHPSVSHYRLAAHFLLALTILGYLYRLSLEFKINAVEVVSKSAQQFILRGTGALLILLFVQFTWGALVAGLKAGKFYPTFPLMNGEIIPSGMMALSPWWKNLVDGVIGVHFTHRLFGWILLIATTAFVSVALGRLPATGAPTWRKNLLLLLAVIWGQFTFGALTVLSQVAIPIAVIHQVGAAFVLLVVIRNNSFAHSMKCI